jgi:hypothetical protein
MMFFVRDNSCPNKTILALAISIKSGSWSLHSVIGGDSELIPNGTDILSYRSDGVVVRNVFNVVRIEAVGGIPNDAGIDVFRESLLGNPIKVDRLSFLRKVCNERSNAISSLNFMKNTKSKSGGRVVLTIHNKSMIFETVTELEKKNKENQVIMLPLKNQGRGSINVQILAAQKKNPEVGFFFKSKYARQGAFKLKKAPAYSLKFVDLTQAIAAEEYNASINLKKAKKNKTKTSAKNKSGNITSFFAKKRGITELTSSDSDSDSDFNDSE